MELILRFGSHHQARPGKPHDSVTLIRTLLPESAFSSSEQVRMEAKRAENISSPAFIARSG